MKPVDQTRFNFSDHPTEAPGNCWAACIASILELDLCEVPDEATVWKPGMNVEESWRLYHPTMIRWLEKRGLSLIDGSALSLEYYTPVHCIITGSSPRRPKANHAVVYFNGELAHDPHPSRAGILSAKYAEFFLKIL